MTKKEYVDPKHLDNVHRTQEFLAGKKKSEMEKQEVREKAKKALAKYRKTVQASGAEENPEIIEHYEYKIKTGNFFPPRK